MKQYEKITHEIINFCYPDRAEAFTNQRKGCSADYIIDGKFCLEVKYDRRAMETGNIFVEYATELDGEETPSGITLSAQNNYKVLYILPDSHKSGEVYLIPAEDLLSLAKTNGSKAKTKPYINGNRLNFYGLGYKLKVDYIKEYYWKRYHV